MTIEQRQHLQRIVARIDKLLAVAEKRTPGAWAYRPFGNYEEFEIEPPLFFAEPAESGELSEGDAAFIAQCAGNAEAGWRATKAAIETALDCQSWDESIRQRYIRQDAETVIESILAAWPPELLDA